MHILVTNDDGVFSPGLLALVQAMRSLGDVSILAPDHNWSGSGHVKTLDRPLRVKEVLLSDGTKALASDGAPSDCVALALMGVVKDVDLVVSGFNPSANLGYDLTYSGTVTAAMEASIFGVRGIAFSLDVPSGFTSELDYGMASRKAAEIVEMLLKHNLPTDVLVNVNIPYLPEDQLKGVQFTRQGLRIYRDVLVERKDPRGKPYYWIGGDAPGGVPEAGTDIGTLERGYISITPVQLDLTDYPLLKKMQAWEQESGS